MLEPTSQTCSQSSVPSAGATLIVRLPLSKQDLVDSVDRQVMWRAVTRAALLDRTTRITGAGIVGNKLAAQTRRSTTSSITNGELAKPHPGSSTPVSAAALRDQRTAPLAASSAFTIPVAPRL